MNVLRLQVYATRRQKIESQSGFLANLSPPEDAIDYPSIQSHKRRDSQQFRIAKHPAAARLLFVMGFAVPGGRGILPKWEKGFCVNCTEKQMSVG